MRRTLTRSVILSSCVAFLLAMGAAFFLRSKQPQHKGEKKLVGLQHNTEVLFDQWAIPHIYAENEHDAYHSLGYLHAQDRLFQMEMMRRLAKGELAEILGPDLVKYDKLFRTLGVPTIAKALARKIQKPDSHEASIKAYIEGINEFISTGSMPLEFQLLGIKPQDFEISDSFAIAGYMAFSFFKGIETDPFLTFLDEHFPPEFKKEISPLPRQHQSSKKDSIEIEALKSLSLFARNILDRPDFFDGSNGWVIAGQRTLSGKPILANDPHIGYSKPDVWYEAAIEYPGFKLYGHYLAGVPVALLGHSDKHGWGVTMLQNKDTDFYREKLNPENKNQVWFRDHWEDLVSHSETIKVKGAADVVIEIKSSRHGPIVNDVIDGFDKIKDPISVLWSFADEDNEVFEAFYNLARAETVEAAEHAASQIRAPGLNIIYANAKNDIAWWTAARFPIRKADAKGKFLLDGASGLDEYQGYYSFASHPKLLNPKQGFIVTANQNPFKNHPYEVAGYYNPDYRYDHIHRDLASKDKGWTVDFVKDVQLQTQNESYRSIRAELVSLLENEKATELEAAALTLMRDWDLKHSIESLGATVFHEVMGTLVEKIFLERLTKTFYDSFRGTNLIHDALVRIISNEHSPWWTDKDGKGTRKEWVLEAWHKSVSALEKTLGPQPTKWNWGRVHTVEHKHWLGYSKLLGWIFNVGPLASHGSSESINNANFKMGPGLHEVKYGPSTRRVIDFVNAGESWGILPTGQSGYFANSHYRDQSPLYHQGQYRLQILDRNALKDAKRLLLTPSKKD